MLAERSTQPVPTLRPAVLALTVAGLLAASSGLRASFWHKRILRDGASLALLERAEENARPAGCKVLAEGRKMTVEDEEILPGACWDYVNVVYERAGYPSSHRKVVFRKKKGGAYAEPADIQAGDWLYYINHSYGGVEHSAIFVAWKDEARREAYMLSYPGEQRRETARYLVYDLSQVYQVVRPKS